MAADLRYSEETQVADKADILSTVPDPRVVAQVTIVVYTMVPQGSARGEGHLGGQPKLPVRSDRAQFSPETDNTVISLFIVLATAI